MRTFRCSLNRSPLLISIVLSIGAFFPASASNAQQATVGIVPITGQLPVPISSDSAAFVSTMDQGKLISIGVGLPLRNPSALQQELAVPAQDRHPVSNEQFNSTYGATPNQVAAVSQWANSSGLQVTYTSPDGLLMIVRGSVGTVEGALKTTINNYRDPSSKRQFFSNASAPLVPAALGIQSISGLNDFYQFKTALAFGPGGGPGGAPATIDMGSGGDTRLQGIDRSSIIARNQPLPNPNPAEQPSFGSGNGSYYPSDFRSLYDLQGHGYDGSWQTIGFTLWGAPVPNGDFLNFHSRTQDPLVAAGLGNDQVQWVPTSANDGSGDPGLLAETAMDVEYAHGMATHSHLKYFLGDCQNTGYGCSPSEAGLLEAISRAANDPTLHIVSNSWGSTGEFTSADPFVLQSAASFQHADAVGTTFYFSSGDGGSNSGGFGFASYPASSPYVVSVGGTSLFDYRTKSGEAYGSESAWGGSGGGCANAFARPTWQVVNGGATCTGRAVPDISADADPDTGALVAVDGGYYRVGGTSLAAPLVAGMAAVTNNYLIQHGQPLMGWAAPTLYALGTGPLSSVYFHDVTCGGNGYSAGQGWDEATGFGSEDWYQYTLGFAGQHPSASPPAGTSWTCQMDVASQGTYLHASTCASSTACLAVGAYGTILRSSNGGSSWDNLNQYYNALSCPLYGECYAVGGNGLIRKTSDDKHWTTLDTGTKYYFTGIACPTEALCYVTSFDGIILRTVDGGATWTVLPTGVSDSLQAIACHSATTCYAVGYHWDNTTGTLYSLILQTTTSGATWTPQTNPGTQPLNGISCSMITATCVAVGSGGTVLITHDSGTTWTAASSGTGDTLTAVSCGSATQCYAVGYHLDFSAGSVTGTILATTDGGTTWTSQNSHTGNFLVAIWCPGAATCYTVGYNYGYFQSGVTGVVQGTTNSGTTWSNLYTGQSGLFGVACSVAPDCVVAGDYGQLLSTANGGAGWTNHGNPNSPDSLYGLSCPTPQVCFGTGAHVAWNSSTSTYTVSNSISVTRDGGDSWSSLPGPVGDIITSLSCPSATVCFGIGNHSRSSTTQDGSILATTNGGVSWTTQVSSVAALASAGSTNLSSITCITTTTCFAVGGYNPGIVLQTTNGGSTWSAVSNPSTYFLKGITCLTITICVMVGGEYSGAAVGSIYSTSDGGQTWTSRESHLPQYLEAVTCSTATACTAVGDGGVVTSTTDGVNWTAQTTPISGVSILNGGSNLLSAAVLSVSCPTSWCFAITGKGAILSPGTAPQPGASLAAAYTVTQPVTSFVPAQTTSVTITLTNIGTATWSSGGANPVKLGIHFMTAGGGCPTYCGGLLTNQQLALPNDVQPGQSVSLSFGVTAPAASGTYVLEYQLVEEGVAWFQQFLDTTASVSGYPSLGASYGTSQPYSFPAGQPLTFNVTVTNTGSSTWPAGGSTPVHLGLHIMPANAGGGCPMNCGSLFTNQRFVLSSDVAPGARTSFPVTMVVPSTPGQYTVEYQMVQEGIAWFSQYLDIPISVGLPDAYYGIGTQPSTILPGSTISQTITLYNAGGTTWQAGGNYPVHLGIHVMPSLGGGCPANCASLLTNQRIALPSDVAPGQSVTIQARIDVPNVSGQFIIEYQMVQEGVGWFSRFSDLPISVAAPSASYSATDQPSTFTTNGSMLVHVVLTNTGPVTWLAQSANPVHLGVHIMAVGGGCPNMCASLFTNLRFILPADVAPGQSVTLPVGVTTPAAPGSYVVEYQLVTEGLSWFSQYLDKPLSLSSWGAQYGILGQPAVFSTGHSVVEEITVTNTGTTTWFAGGGTPVHLGIHFMTGGGGCPGQCAALLTNERYVLQSDVPPGGTVTIGAIITPPTVTSPTALTIEYQLVAEGLAWFPEYVDTPTFVTPYAGAYSAAAQPSTFAAGTSVATRVTLTNTGTVTWQSGGLNPVHLGVHFMHAGGGCPAACASLATNQRFMLPADVPPGATVTLSPTIIVPSTPGQYVLEDQLVEEGITWFAEYADSNVAVMAVR